MQENATYTLSTLTSLPVQLHTEHGTLNKTHGCLVVEGLISLEGEGLEGGVFVLTLLGLFLEGVLRLGLQVRLGHVPNVENERRRKRGRSG